MGKKRDCGAMKNDGAEGDQQQLLRAMHDDDSAMEDVNDFGR